MLKKGKDCIGITVTFFCHDEKGNFVLSKRGKSARDENGRWDPGGGSVEFGETIEQTLKQEILEEYGSEVKSFEFLGFRDVFREQNGDQTHWISFDYSVLVNRDQVTNCEPHKFDAVEWFTWETIPSDDEMHSQWPEFERRYRDRLV